MIFAYLIQAHDKPEQLARLIGRLLQYDSDDFAVIHIDAKSALWRYNRSAVTALGGPRVIAIDRPLSVSWGHQTQVGATLSLLRTAATRPYDAAHLLSGTDWPIAPRARIVADMAGLPCCIETTDTTQQERMQRYWLHDSYLNPWVKGGTTYRTRRKLLQLGGRVLDRMGAVRSCPYGDQWRKGSSWWSLPREACDVVTAELTQIMRSGRLRFTACSDEHVIQSIVASHFANRIGPNRRFVDWSERLSSPRILTVADCAQIIASNAWFARKVDSGIDDFFLDAFRA